MKEKINIIIKIAFLACFIYSLILFKQYLELEKFHNYNRLDGGGFLKLDKLNGNIYLYDLDDYKWKELKDS